MRRLLYPLLWLRCRLVGHRFRPVYWPDLEPGGYVCLRCGLENWCGCRSCQERLPGLPGKGRDR